MKAKKTTVKVGFKLVNTRCLNKIMVSIYKKLKSKLKGKVAFVGVGNVLKGDDGAGVVLVNMLKKRFKDAGSFLDCGIAPENYLEKLRGFDCVVIFDALDFGGKTGEITILKPKELSEMSVSTHNHSPDT